MAAGERTQHIEANTGREQNVAQSDVPIYNQLRLQKEHRGEGDGSHRKSFWVAYRPAPNPSPVLLCTILRYVPPSLPKPNEIQLIQLKQFWKQLLKALDVR